MNTHTRRRDAGRPARRSPVTVLLGTAGAVAASVAIALLGTGTSYALWSGELALESSAVRSGSTGLTVNGASAYDLAGLDVTRLAPGASVAAPIRVANTGTTELAIVPSAEVTAQAAGLGDHLLLSLAPASACAATTGNPPGAPLAPLATLGAGIDPYLLGAGNTLDLCLAVTLSGTAPATVQGGSAAFTLTLDAVQSDAVQPDAVQPRVTR